MRYADVMEQFEVPEVVARSYESLELIAQEDESTNYQMLWFMDALVRPLALLESFVRFQNDRSGWANTMDPTTIPEEGLSWLGQFPGVEIDPASRVTPRQQVIDHVNWDRGSVPGIEAYITQFLVGLQRVHIIERSMIVDGFIQHGFPWRYVVVVRQEDLGGLTYNELAAQEPTYNVLAADYPTYEGLGSVIVVIEQAVLDSKPGGDLTQLLVATVIYEDLYPGFGDTPAYPTYQDLQDGFASYTAVQAYIPPE